VNPSNYHHPNLSLASGATALGSIKPRHLSQVQTDDPLPLFSASYFARFGGLVPFRAEIAPDGAQAN
jgi:hypothetical protein